MTSRYIIRVTCYENQHHTVIIKSGFTHEKLISQLLLQYYHIITILLLPYCYHIAIITLPYCYYHITILLPYCCYHITILLLSYFHVVMKSCLSQEKLICNIVSLILLLHANDVGHLKGIQ